MALNALDKIYKHKKMRKRKIITISTISFSLILLFGININQSKNSAPVYQQNNVINYDDTSKNKDIIVINPINSIVSVKYDIELFPADLIKMTALELNEYFGINVFPTVPNDLVNSNETDNFTNYGIYQKNNTPNSVYWDQNILNYSNHEGTRTICIEIAKNNLPVIDYFTYQDKIEASTISGNCVYLGYDNTSIYQAYFIYNNVGFVLTTNGLSQDEVIAVIKSIFE